MVSTVTKRTPEGDRAFDLTADWLEQNFEPLQPVAEHFFGTGLYVRVMRLPAGARIVTKIHKTRHPLFIMQGEALVFSENEGEVHYRAPCMVITNPGTRRLVVAHTDLVWVTVHASQSQDLEVIESEIIEPRINPVGALRRVIETLSHES